MTAEVSQQRFSDLIGSIYDCTLDPRRWDETLHAIKDLMECEQGFLRLDDLVTKRPVIFKSAGIEPYWLERQAAMAREVTDILVRVLESGHSMDEPSAASRFMTRAELDVSPYNQEWGRPQGLVDYMDLFLLYSPTRLASVGLARHERFGLMAERQFALGRLLIPHLRRAVMISDLLNAQIIEKSRVSEALDALQLGIVIADEDSHILHANRAAENMMRNNDPLRNVGGVLRAGGPRASTEISVAISRAASDESAMGEVGLSVRLTREDQQPAIAHVLPLTNGAVLSTLSPTAAAAVFVSSTFDDGGGAHALATAFAFTPAEARVLQRLLAGKTLTQAAADLGVALSTARTHLQTIFAKTDVSRQAELLRLASSLAPVGARQSVPRSREACVRMTPAGPNGPTRHRRGNELRSR